MGIVHQDEPGGTLVGVEVPGGDGIATLTRKDLAADLDGALRDLPGDRVVGRQLKILGQCMSLALGIHQGGGVGREHGAEFGELLGFCIIEHPVLGLA
ncbi:MAG: hypothetical protein HOD72_01315, partial [Opitutae bacterium]|nr:hypothetical protein [Opitutae bacterium]